MPYEDIDNWKEYEELTGQSKADLKHAEEESMRSLEAMFGKAIHTVTIDDLIEDDIFRCISHIKGIAQMYKLPVYVTQGVGSRIHEAGTRSLDYEQWAISLCSYAAMWAKLGPREDGTVQFHFAFGDGSNPQTTEIHGQVQIGNEVGPVVTFYLPEER